MGTRRGHRIISHLELIPINQTLRNVFEDIAVFNWVAQYLVVRADQRATASSSLLRPFGLWKEDFAVVIGLVKSLESYPSGRSKASVASLVV